MFFRVNLITVGSCSVHCPWVAVPRCIHQRRLPEHIKQPARRDCALIVRKGGYSQQGNVADCKQGSRQ